jgi:hypothetical protein
MTITPRNEDYLFVKLDEGEASPDLDWYEMVRVEVPERDRSYSDQLGGWLVHRRHKQLLGVLHYIYTTLTAESPSSAELELIPKMLESIRHWKPQQRILSQQLAEMTGFRKEQMSRN